MLVRNTYLGRVFGIELLRFLYSYTVPIAERSLVYTPLNVSIGLI